MEFKAPLEYKGNPLVRNKNEIYYGSMDAPYVVYMQILSTQIENDEELPQKVAVMLLSTDTSLPLKDRIVKQSVKTGFYNAIDFANILLERFLAEKKK